MKVLFHLGHPAHFHLFKNVINELKDKGHQTFILIKKKDVLEDLLKENGYNYHNILPSGRKDSFLSIGFALLKQDWGILKFCLKEKVDMLVGTSASISHVGMLIRKTSLVVGEDDAAAVPLLAKISYPFASAVVTPDVCKNGKWEYKCIKYKGYHELAYLHPNYFKPQRSVVEKYIDLKKPFFLLRFAKLGAHHDKGIEGINDNIAMNLVNMLKPHGNIYITSEREIKGELNEHRLNINPKDIHHIMAYASFYIGDSQTMAAEAGVLGIPFIRFNDFVGRIGYLEDLENKYKLGFGVKTENVEDLYKKVVELIQMKDRKDVFQKRRQIMLSNKIDVVEYLTDLIINYNKK